MPTYLLHGFRWHRRSIRVHIVLNNLDDAAPEWIIAPATSITLLNSFYSLFDFLPPSHPPSTGAATRPPATSAGEETTKDAGGHRVLTKKRSIPSLGLLARPVSRMLSTSDGPYKSGQSSNDNGNGNSHTNGPGSSTESSPEGTSESLTTLKEPRFNDWSVVKFIEQYDANELVVSQPWAYVADYVIEVKLGASITEEMMKYEAWKNEIEGAASSAEVMSPGVAGSRASTLSMSAHGMRRRSKWIGWLDKLKDALQKGEEIGWHVVVCEDEERPYSATDSDREREDVVPEQFVERKTHRTSLIKDLLNRRRSAA
ncbi:hypothetical protein F5884DRAFT_677782 [Xylogone sp. PMI_703]|nr:hypothetical protein F5884DRAFT_677782 [Xylogone sp. PMI_703]